MRPITRIVTGAQMRMEMRIWAAITTTIRAGLRSARF